MEGGERMGLAASNSALCKRRSRETLAAQSEQSLSVPGTEMVFLHFFLFLRRPFAALLCSEMLKPNLPVVLLLSQSIVIFEPTACVLQLGLHRSLDLGFFPL